MGWFAQIFGLIGYRLSFVFAIMVAAGLVFLYQRYSPIRSDLLLGGLILLPMLGWVWAMFLQHVQERQEEKDKFN